MNLIVQMGFARAAPHHIVGVEIIVDKIVGGLRRGERRNHLKHPGCPACFLSLMHIGISGRNLILHQVIHCTVAALQHCKLNGKVAKDSTEFKVVLFRA